MSIMYMPVKFQHISNILQYSHKKYMKKKSPFLFFGGFCLFLNEETEIQGG